jgi:hypothetical protein
MAGNAWEWLQDWWHESYDRAPADGGAREDSGSNRVFRGGSWINDAGNARSTYRYSNPPGSRCGHLGFRVARSGVVDGETQEPRNRAAPLPVVANAVMTLVSGDIQKAARTSASPYPAHAKFGPLQVKVTANGKPLSGVQISWTCAHPSPMSCQTEPSGAAPTITTTNVNGVATLNKMPGNKSVYAYYGDGAITITAAYGHAIEQFHLTVE